MKTLELLLDVGHRIAHGAEGLVDDIEVLLTRSDDIGYELRNRDLVPELSLGHVQVGIRALKAGRIALAATTTLDVEQNLAALRAALPTARPTALESFSSAQVAPDVGGYDGQLGEFEADPNRLRALAADIRDRLFGRYGTDPRLEAMEGALGYAVHWEALVTRHGHGAWKQNYVSAYTDVNNAHYESVFLGEAPSDDYRAVKDLALRTFQAIPPVLVTPKDLGVEDRVVAIVHPELVEGILRRVAEEKFLGSSRLSGMTDLQVGARIWDPAITLTDTTCQAPLVTRVPFDDELTPAQATVLVDQGTFEHFVYSRLSAKENGTQPTANGFRRPILVEEPNEAPVRDKLSGLVMAPGEDRLEDLIAGIDRGIVIKSLLGLHGADRARASFSTTVHGGFAIRDGKVVARLAPGSWNVSGGAFTGEAPSVFSRVALSREREDTGSALLPWVRMEVGI